MNKPVMKGNWNVVRGKLKEKYGSLTDDDLTYAEGQENQLVGKIQQRLGKNREEVVDELQRLQMGI